MLKFSEVLVESFDTVLSSSIKISFVSFVVDSVFVFVLSEVDD